MIQNLNYYMLAASKRYSSFSVESGLKYFLLGAFSSGLLLFGISLIYVVYGDLNFESLYYLLLYKEFVIFDFYLCFAFSFLLIGMFFKLGASPFHWWVIDVYVGAPTIMTLFFSMMPKMVYVFVLMKFIFYFFMHEQLFFSFFFFMIGMMSILIGFINAMFQEDLKNFLAYSTISNMGYMVVGLGTFDINMMAYVILYMVCYLISIFSMFFCLVLYTKKNNVEVKTVYDLTLYTKYSGTLGFFVAINFFSFAGMPPFSGFFAKLYMFFSMMEMYYFFGMFLLLLSSVISVFYYISLMSYMFFSNVEGYAPFFKFKYLELFVVVSFFNMFFMLFFESVVKLIMIFLLKLM